MKHGIFGDFSCFTIFLRRLVMVDLVLQWQEMNCNEREIVPREELLRERNCRERGIVARKELY